MTAADAAASPATADAIDTTTASARRAPLSARPTLARGWVSEKFVQEAAALGIALYKSELGGPTRRRATASCSTCSRTSSAPPACAARTRSRDCAPCSARSRSGGTRRARCKATRGCCARPTRSPTAASPSRGSSLCCAPPPPTSSSLPTAGSPSSRRRRGATASTRRRRPRSRARRGRGWRPAVAPIVDQLVRALPSGTDPLLLAWFDASPRGHARLWVPPGAAAGGGGGAAAHVGRGRPATAGARIEQRRPPPRRAPTPRTLKAPCSSMRGRRRGGRRLRRRGRRRRRRRPA